MPLDASLACSVCWLSTGRVDFDRIRIYRDSPLLIVLLGFGSGLVALDGSVEVRLQVFLLGLEGFERGAFLGQLPLELGVLVVVVNAGGVCSCCCARRLGIRALVAHERLVLDQTPHDAHNRGDAETEVQDEA